MPLFFKLLLSLYYNLFSVSGFRAHMLHKNPAEGILTFAFEGFSCSSYQRALPVREVVNEWKFKCANGQVKGSEPQSTVNRGNR